MNVLVTKLAVRDRLSPEEAKVLEDVCSPPKLVPTGQDMVREGDRPTVSTLMLEGFCGRYNDLRDGRRQISAIHIAGDFVDLHSFPLHVMDHGVVALSPCRIATVSHEALRTITEHYPHLTRLLWMGTLIDAAINRRWLVAMGRLSSTAQLAHLLCELRVRLGIVGLCEGASYSFPLTQTEVADVLGLSLVHVNRVVQELRREGLITWAGGRIVILDLEKLEALAEFDSRYLHLESEPR